MTGPFRLMRLAFTALVFLATLAVSPGNADNGTTVAIIDMERIRQESKAGQSIERQVGEFRSLLAAEINARETDLREKEEQLRQQSALLTQEAFEERRQEFEQDVLRHQGEVQDLRANLERVYVRAVETLHVGIVQILGNLVAERGIDVVLDRRHYLIAGTDLDITEEVLTELDASLSEIEVTPPSES